MILCTRLLASNALNAIVLDDNGFVIGQSLRSYRTSLATWGLGAAQIRTATKILIFALYHKLLKSNILSKPD
jgi:hypothetical protein